MASRHFDTAPSFALDPIGSSAELRALRALVDGPRHESEVCDRGLQNLLERRGWISRTPAERGLTLAITDVGRSQL